MAQGNPVGTMYVELSLDATKYTAAQKRILNEAKQNSADINRVFSVVGTKTDEMFNAMRQQVQNAYNAIAKSANSSADEIRRAHEGMARKIENIDEQQFGKRTSLLESFKKNWLIATAAIAAATMAASKVWDLIKIGAAYEERMGMLNNLAAKYKTNADTIISEMDRASDHQIAKSELMTIALGGIAKGLNPEQLINLANAAETLGDAVGKSATEAFNDLTQALETGRTRGLKNYLGTAIDLEQTFGKLQSQLTDTEKAQAMYSLTMIAAIDIQNQQNETVDKTADNIAKLQKRYEDASLTAAQFFKYTFAWWMETLGFMDNAISKTGEFQTLISGAPYVRMSMPERPKEAKSKTVYEEQLEAMKKLLQGRKDLEDKDKSAEAAAKKYNDAVIKSLEELDKVQDSVIKSDEEGQKKALKNATDFMAKRIELEEKATEQMVKDAHLGYEFATEEYTQRHDEITKQLEASQSLWTQISNTTAQAMEGSFSDFFFDVMTGNFENLGDMGKGMLETLQRAVSDFMADQAVQALFGSPTASGSREGGFLQKLIPIASSLISGLIGGSTTGGDFAGVTDAWGMSWHQGGKVGAGGYRIPRLHGGLKPDEFPAILQAGEEVIPRDEAKKGQGLAIGSIQIQAVDAVSFTELAARNPQAIVGPFLNALKQGGFVVDTLRSAVR